MVEQHNPRASSKLRLQRPWLCCHQLISHRLNFKQVESTSLLRTRSKAKNMAAKQDDARSVLMG